MKRSHTSPSLDSSPIGAGKSRPSFLLPEGSGIAALLAKVPPELQCVPSVRWQARAMAAEDALARVLARSAAHQRMEDATTRVITAASAVWVSESPPRLRLVERFYLWWKGEA